MKCRVCGYELNPNREYCDMCGTKVVEISSSGAEETPKSADSESEFSWNVYSFPKPKQPGNISIEWPEYDYVDPATGSFVNPDGRIQQAVDKNEPVVIVNNDVSEGFVAVPDEKENVWQAPMEESTKKAEKFFTFQKKNEEFQRLLDKEYEKLMRRQKGEEYREEPFHSTSAPVVWAEDVSEFEKMLMDNTKDADLVTGDTLPINLEKVQEEVRAQEAARMQQNEEAYQIQRETIEKKENELREAILNAEISKLAEEPESIERIKGQNRERIDAMAKAREAYFESQAIKMDDEDDVLFTAKPAFSFVADQGETVQNTVINAQSSQIQENSTEEQPAQNQTEISEGQPSQIQENSPEVQADQPQTDRPDVEPLQDNEPADAFTPFKSEKKPKKHRVWKFLLILILILVILEAAVISLRAFAPDNEWTHTASEIEKTVIDQAVEWGTATKQFVIVNLEKLGLDLTSQEADSSDAADAEPKFDLGALVAQYNKNIKSVTESPTLGYESTGEYEIEGLDAMGIAEDIDTKEAVYGCLISFNSKWVDYVNKGEDKSCLDLLKADGEAYRSALNFSKVGEIEEVFEALTLGEIRYTENEYYVFVREQISVTEAGDTSLSSYSWLYRLEDIAGEKKIVDYTAFKN